MASFVASLDRLGGPGAGAVARHAGAIATAAALVAVMETRIPVLDHGTHLLVVLAAIVGTALVLGPGPAGSGLAAGGTVAGAASALGIAGVDHAAGAAVQLVAYLAIGGAAIVLVALVARARRPTAPGFDAAPAAAAGAKAIAPADAAAEVPHAPALRADGVVESLTAREAAVLHLATSGASVDEMARLLCVSPNTVKTHLTHIYAKLGVRGRTDAVRAALHAGLLTPGDICPHRFEEPDESPVPVTTGSAPPSML